MLRYSILIVSMLPWLIAAGGQALLSPEVEIQHASTKLQNIESALKSSTKILDTKLIGPRRQSAGNAFDHATDLFRHGHFMAAARQLNYYLDNTQVPTTAKNMAANRMLGQAYEQSGFSERALRAYMNFIATFTTAPTDERNYDELTDIMRRALPLAAKADDGSTADLNRLFANVISLGIPKARKAEVLYFAASSTKNSEQAEQWFSESSALTDDPAIVSRANYFRAIIALQKGDKARAAELFATNLKLADVAATKYHDLSRLALARIATKERNLDRALKHYDLIPADSPSRKDALFESMYLLVDKGSAEAAAKAAEELASKFPESNEGIQARTLLSYFALNSGKIDAAKALITGIDKDLMALNDWITHSYSHRRTLDQRDVNNLAARTTTELGQSSVVVIANRAFESLAQSHRRLADLRSEIRDIFFVLGDTNLSGLRPSDNNRDLQLQTLSEQSLEVGHRLMSSFRQVIADKLTPSEGHALESSEKRRFRLLSHAAKLSRQKANWATWANAVQLVFDATEKGNRLRTLQADIAAMRYAVSQGSKAGVKKDLALLSQKAKEMETSLNRTIELIHRHKLGELPSQGTGQQAQRFHGRYANLLHEEASIILRHLDELQSPSWRSLAKDAAQTWKRWEFTSKSVFEGLQKQNAEVSSEISELVSQLDEYVKEHNLLVDRSSQLRASLEAILGKSVESTLAFYDNQVKERLARHKKWQADMEWIKFEHLKNEEDALDRRKKLQTQLLRDNLRDLRQGVIW